RDDRFSQTVVVDASFEREQSADAVECESPTELDRGKELDADDENERERIGSDESNRRDPDTAKSQIENTAVLAVLVVEIAAAGNDPRVDAPSCRIRQPRRKRDGQSATTSDESDLHAATVDNEIHHTAELSGDRRRQLELRV